MNCLCPGCGREEPADGAACSACGEPLELNGRYRLVRVLGDNASVTYLGRDASEGREVIIKELSLHRVQSWKEEELFQRQVDVLRSLNHPGIPAYLDRFRIDARRHVIHYLVIERVDGVTLKEESRGRRYSEGDVLEIVIGALEILDYLQSNNPPVFHRDIKPSNLMRSSAGGIHLIDFDVVSDMARSALQGNTIAGTYGYMAPEQFAGMAFKQTDIYSLGVLAVALLSGRDPGSLMGNGLELDWEGAVDVGPGMRGLIRSFTARNPEDRPRDAAEALLMARGAMIPLSAASGTAPVEASPRFIDSPRFDDVPEDGPPLFPFVTGDAAAPVRESQETWSWPVSDPEGIPERFRPSLGEEANGFPYAVLSPAEKGRGERVTMLTERGIAVMEASEEGISRIDIPLASISTIVHEDILLDSRIEAAAEGNIISLAFNSANAELFEPLVARMRAGAFSAGGLRASPRETAEKKARFSYIKNAAYALYSMAVDSIPDEAAIVAHFFQPGVARRGLDMPAFLLVVTDREIILLEEFERREPAKRFAGKKGKRRRYVRLDAVESVLWSDNALSVNVRDGEPVIREVSPDNPEAGSFAETVASMDIARDAR